MDHFYINNLQLSIKNKEILEQSLKNWKQRIQIYTYGVSDKIKEKMKNPAEWNW
jgi:hypothetical protein